MLRNVPLRNRQLSLSFRLASPSLLLNSPLNHLLLSSSSTFVPPHTSHLFLPLGRRQFSTQDPSTTSQFLYPSSPSTQFSQSTNLNSPNNPHHSVEALRDQLNKVVVAGRQISALVWGVGLILSTFIASIFLFKDQIKSLFSHQTADVASAALDHQAVQDKASAFGKVTVQQILDDRDIVDKSVGFVKDLLVETETVNSASQLFTQVLGKESVITAASLLGRQVSKSVLEDPATMAEFTKLVSETLSTPEVYESCKSIVSALAQDPQTAQDLVKLANALMGDEQFRLVMSETISYLLLELMRNKEVESQTAIFLSHLLAQEDLHRSGGEALRSSMSHFLFGSLLSSLPFLGSKTPSTPTPITAPSRPSLDDIRPSSEVQKSPTSPSITESKTGNNQESNQIQTSTSSETTSPSPKTHSETTTLSSMEASISSSEIPDPISSANVGPAQSISGDSLETSASPTSSVVASAKDKDDPDRPADSGIGTSSSQLPEIQASPNSALLSIEYDPSPSSNRDHLSLNNLNENSEIKTLQMDANDNSLTENGQNLVPRIENPTLDSNNQNIQSETRDASSGTTTVWGLINSISPFSQ